MARTILSNDDIAKRYRFVEENPELSAAECVKLAGQRGVRGVTTASVYYLRDRMKRAKSPVMPSTPTPAASSGNAARVPLVDLRKLVLRVGLDAAQRELDALRRSTEGVLA